MDKKNNLLKFLFNWGIYFLVIIFCFLTLVGFKTISELIYPTFIFGKILLFEDSKALTGAAIFWIVVRYLLLFSTSYLMIMIFSLITAIFSYNSYMASASKYPYNTFQLDKILTRGLNWNIYRTFQVIFPPFTVLTAGILLFLSLLYFFNFYLTFAGWSIGLVTFITTFVFTGLIFCFIFSLVLSFYNLITTLFGIECAVSEPDLSNNVIKKRSARLSFNNPYNFILYVLYLIFIISVIGEFVLALDMKSGFDSDFKSNILIACFVNVIFLFSLGRLKAHLYVESLLKQYNLITLHDKNVSF